MIHTLAHNGAAHDDSGEPIDPTQRSRRSRVHKYTGGEGRGKCSGCGALSVSLPNGASRRRWFAWHKENAPAEAEQPEIEMSFTSTLAKYFWASLAVNGTREYLKKHFPQVKLRADYDTSLIYLSGPNAADAVPEVQQLWEDAAKEFYVWRKTDPVYRSLQHHRPENRRASYKLTKTFLINYCASR